MADLDERGIPYHLEGIGIVSSDRRAYRLFKSTGRVLFESW